MSPLIADTRKAVWYLSRGSGAVSLVLLSGSTVLGILTSTRASSWRWPRFVVEGLHRNISLAANLFLALHIVTVVVDDFVPIGWLDAVVPFRSAYRPLWLGLGALAFDLILAIVATSLLRARLGQRAWRTVHWFAYACWPLAVVHGIGSGSDRLQVWMLALEAVCILAVLAAAIWRLTVALRARAGRAEGVPAKPMVPPTRPLAASP